jgi:sugar O-acyltransferase (sialic acid O-acetyltransferase NeuD family)
MINKPKILLIGGGGHCKSVIDIIEQEDRWTIAGIIDKKELIGTKVLDYTIIGCDDDLEQLFLQYKYAIVTIGHIKTNQLRVKLFNTLQNIGYTIPTIISPLAYVSKYAFIDKGTVIHHQALINANAKIGKNCIINSKALIEHDVVIEDNCHISTGAIINGGVVVSENTFVGSNATTKEYITINKFIKAGSLVK